MAIYIIAWWRQLSKQEQRAQSTGSDVVKEHVGYLQEAYDGEPYAARVLVPEAFETGEAQIPAALMRERLPKVVALAIRRAKAEGARDVDEESEVVRSFIDFVSLCEAKERETGEPCTIIARPEIIS